MEHSKLTKAIALALATTISFCTAAPAFADSHSDTATPIKHVVIIFQENVSFDHYFATYPNATNPNGEPAFHARRGTPTVNGLQGALLNNNPNFLNSANGAGASNPFRLDRSQAHTQDQNHDYTAEQSAFDMGLLDLFPKFTGTSGPPPGGFTTTGLVMGYFDGNTVTALWNYAQHYAMSDNSYGTSFGPSTPGLMNLVSGQTNGVTMTKNGTGDEIDGGSSSLTVVGDPDPIGDVCSAPARNQVQMSSKNIGDLLTAAGVTWGAFMGGFDLTITNANGTTGCKRSSTSPITGTTKDYIPHHAFFQYYASTANPMHTRPASVSEIGNAGPANHQYDINDFFAALKADNLPAVSILKAIALQDGHAGYSDPLDEQTFLVNVINALQKSREWKETAVVILYDDSDGWYDHQMGPIVNPSTSPADTLSGPGACGDGSTALPGPGGTAHAQGRCGYAMRQPLLVISPWSKENFVDHTVTDQTSVLRFIEDNWLGGQRIGDGSFDALANPINQMFNFSRERDEDGRVLILDPATGQPVAGPEHDRHR